MPLQLLSLLISLVSALSLSLDTLGQATSLGGYLALVNRDYVLAADYEPDDLVRPNVKATNGSAILMRSEAAAALEELFAAAKDEAGLTLYAASGYRSYGTQSAIFERKIKNTGSREKAQRLVAPPGASEKPRRRSRSRRGSRRPRRASRRSCSPDHPPVVHDQDPVGQVADDAEIV